MTHAQTAQAGTSFLFPTAAAALAAVVALSAAIALTQPLPTVDLRIGAETQSQALIDAGRAWEAQRKQQMIAGGVSTGVLESARLWEERYHQTTPAVAPSVRGAEKRPLDRGIQPD
jgi:hypothetical protein